MISEKDKIISISNPKIKYIKSLLLRKNRNQTGLFLAEGERTCREAIEHKWNPKYLIYSNEKNQTINFNDLIFECKKNNGLVLNVTTKIIGKISKKDNPQTILGVFEQKIFNIEHLIDDGSIAFFYKNIMYKLR